MAGILVVCETQAGRLKKGSREALSIGRSLATDASIALSAVAFGADGGAVANEAGRLGATTLFTMSDATLDGYSTERWTAALAAVIAEANPNVVLFSGSSDGRDLAPRIAARLGVAVASDVTGLAWDSGKLRALRPVYSGKAVATVEFAATPAMATCRPNAFPAVESDGPAATVQNVPSPTLESRARLIERKVPETGELSIAEADIIVAGGRGLKEAGNYSYIRDLANALGAAAVGASRATVDAGWIEHQHQVGQTGRVVSPNLYIAIGISGAIQHLAGMSSSKHIVAINKDAEAPIFRVADLGVVGDLFQILPALTEEVKKARDQH